MPTIKTRSRRETRAVQEKLRAQGRSYVTVRNGRKAESWMAPARKLNPGRGAPGAASAPQALAQGTPRAHASVAPGGSVSRTAPLPRGGTTSLGGHPETRPGYTRPMYDADTGEWTFLTQDYLSPGGYALRERQNMEVELPDVFGGIEHINNNPGYWEGQFATFARDHPVLTGAGAFGLGALAIQTGAVYGRAAESLTRSRGYRAPVGIRSPRAGGAGSYASTIQRLEALRIY